MATRHLINETNMPHHQLLIYVEKLAMINAALIVWGDAAPYLQVVQLHQAQDLLMEIVELGGQELTGRGRRRLEELVQTFRQRFE